MMITNILLGIILAVIVFIAVMIWGIGEKIANNEDKPKR